MSRVKKTLSMGVLILPFFVTLGWGIRNEYLADHYSDALTEMRKQAKEVVLAVRDATGKEITWEEAPQAIRGLGNSNNIIKIQLAETNKRVDELAREAVKSKFEADDLRVIIAKAEAQRDEALRGLADAEKTRKERDDYRQLLEEADKALDIVRESGL